MRGKLAVVFLCALLASGVFILSFASVPLYRLFCQRTGYGGTPRIDSSKNDPSFLGKRVFKIRFNADIHHGLPCSFIPLQQELILKTGELGLAFYRVRNNVGYPVKGIATYNVTPDKAGPYFHKVECFCFEEQEFGGKKTVDLPVQFYIDSDISKNHAMDDVATITLSYTFFKLRDK